MNIEEAIGMFNRLPMLTGQRNGSPKYEITGSNIHSIVQKEIGIVFTKVLEDAGVYKRTEEGKLHSKDLLKVYKKGILHFCEMVLRKIFSFHKIVLLVFIHDMDAQNSQRRILKGRSDIF